MSHDNLVSLSFRSRRGLTISPGKSRPTGRDMTLPARPRGNTLQPSPTFDWRNFENDDEGDYMDMTPKTTPKRITPTSRHGKITRSHTVENFLSRGSSESLAVESKPRSEALKNSKLNQFEECEYADMTVTDSTPTLSRFGRHSSKLRHISPLPSPLRNRSHTEQPPQTMTSSPSVDEMIKLRSSTLQALSVKSGSAEFLNSSPSRQSLRRSPSPNWQILKSRYSPLHQQPSSPYLEGSYDKDDDDDYEVIDSMKPRSIRNSARLKPSDSQSKSLPRRSLSRTAQKTLPSNRKLTSSPLITSSSPREATVRSPRSHDKNNNDTFKFNTVNRQNTSNQLPKNIVQTSLTDTTQPVQKNEDTKTNFASKANLIMQNRSNLTINSGNDEDSSTRSSIESTTTVNPVPPDPVVPSQTVVECSGENGDSSISHPKLRSQSADVGGSLSQNGPTEVVQNRIHKVRKNQSFTKSHISPINEDGLQIPSLSNDKNTKLNQSLSDSNATSGTPSSNIPAGSSDSSLSDDIKLLVIDSRQKAQSLQNLVSKGRDGAKVMRANSKGKDHSPNKEYFEWFAKTAPYSIRKPSIGAASALENRNLLSPNKQDLIQHSTGQELAFKNAATESPNTTGKSRDDTIEANRTKENSSETPAEPKKKKRNFWRLKKEKSKSVENMKIFTSKEEPKKSIENDSKIKKSRKTWKIKSKKNRSSVKLLQNGKETVAGLKYEKNTDASEPIQSLTNKTENKSSNNSQMDVTKPKKEDHKKNQISPLTICSSSIAASCDKAEVSISNPGFNNHQQSTGNSMSKKITENNTVDAEQQHTVVKQCEVPDGLPKSMELKNDQKNIDASADIETENAPLGVQSRRERANPLQPLSVPLLDISQAFNYEDDIGSSLPLSPLPRKIYGSIKSKTLGRIFNKKGSMKKPHEGANTSYRCEDSLASDFNNSPTWKVGDSTFYKEALSDPQTPKSVEKDADFLSEFDTNHKLLTHGFILCPSSYQNDKQKRRRFSGRKKDQYLTLYNSIKRLRSKSSELDEVGTPNSTPEIPVDHLDERSAFTDDDLCGSEDKINSSNELFYIESAPSPNAKPKLHPIFQNPSTKALDVARLLLHCIKSSQPELISGYEEIEEDSHQFLMVSDNSKPSIDDLLRRSYAKGHDLVTWTQSLLRVKQKFEEKSDISYKAALTPTRRHIAGMWQVLFEQGAIFQVKSEEQFEDRNFYYGFHEEVTTPHLFPNSFNKPLDHDDSKFTFETVEHTKTAQTMVKLISYWMDELYLADGLSYLNKHCHDAMFRKALRQQPEKRTPAELVMIYEEILHIKTLAHLSDSVKRELAGVFKFEFHQDSGTILFRQGDEGTSWYIILHGSVKVDVLGKGIVCTLQEGAEFGDLALVNDAPRSATIISNEPNCHFMRVDKQDFMRILKDVEANTVRLKEHDEDVLILEKIRSTSRGSNEKIDSAGDLEHDSGNTKQSYRYVVTAGTPERILEHTLEYIQPWRRSSYEETLEDFILMYPVFMKTGNLFEILLKNYKAEDPLSISFEKSMKRKIVYFVVRWSHIVRYLREDREEFEDFLQELSEEIEFDSVENPDYKQLKAELTKMHKLDDSLDIPTNNNVDTKPGTYIIMEECARMYQAGVGPVDLHRPIRESDEVLLKVYNCDKEYATLKVPLSSTADEILQAAAEKMNQHEEEDKRLYEVQESGECIAIPKNRRSIITSININSVLSICDDKESHCLSKSLHDSLPNHNDHFDVVSSLEMAYYITEYDWALVDNVHVLEYVYKVFGPKKFSNATPNLDVLSRRFNQLAYWAPTEICSCSNVNKRALMLRKFIKLAQHLKMYQNMNAFMAVTIGICNQSVSRLSGTWEKIPTKYRKMMNEFEAILDPSRNHRKYRVLASALQPPFIPYFPLLMKDMTFQHEGNKNQKQNLVNFEKMHMISNSIKTIIRGCSEKIDPENLSISAKAAEETKNYIKSFKVISDQKTLNELSAQIEPKR